MSAGDDPDGLPKWLNALVAPMAAFALAAVMVATVIVMLVGLFDPRVDNKAIFAIVGPTFHDVTVALIALVAVKFGRDHPS